MTLVEFHSKYKEVIKSLPKLALTELIDRLRNGNEVSRKEAYKIILSKMTLKQKLSMYIRNQGKLKQIFRNEELAQEFLKDLKAVSFHMLLMKLV